MFLLEYDDPRKAAAFPILRSEFDWKMRLRDRKAVVSFLQQERHFSVERRDQPNQREEIATVVRQKSTTPY